MSHGEWKSARTTTQPKRLIEAADAILLAAQQSPRGSVRMWKDDQRPSSDGFSSNELVDAMMFLRRLGCVSADWSVVSNPRST